MRDNGYKQLSMSRAYFNETNEKGTGYFSVTNLDSNEK